MKDLTILVCHFTGIEDGNLFVSTRSDSRQGGVRSFGVSSWWVLELKQDHKNKSQPAR